MSPLTGTSALFFNSTITDLCHQISIPFLFCPKEDILIDGGWVGGWAKGMVIQPVFMLPFFLQSRKEITLLDMCLEGVNNTTHMIYVNKNNSSGKFWLGQESCWSPDSVIMMTVIGVSQWKTIAIIRKLGMYRIILLCLTSMLLPIMH